MADIYRPGDGGPNCFEPVVRSGRAGDSPFSPPDLMGEWRLGASLAWDGAARDLTASLEDGTTRLDITARCTDR